jgi:hypothetical protein
LKTSRENPKKLLKIQKSRRCFEKVADVLNFQRNAAQVAGKSKK